MFVIYPNEGALLTTLNRSFSMLVSLVRCAVELDVCVIAPQLLWALLRGLVGGLYRVCDAVVKSGLQLCRLIRITHNSQMSCGIEM